MLLRERKYKEQSSTDWGPLLFPHQVATTAWMGPGQTQVTNPELHPGFQTGMVGTQTLEPSSIASPGPQHEPRLEVEQPVSTWKNSVADIVPAIVQCWPLKVV